MRLPAWRALAGALLISLAGSLPAAACAPSIDVWEQVESSDLIILAKVEAVEPTLLGRWLEKGDRLFDRLGRSLWLEALGEMIPLSWHEPPLGRLVLRPSETWKGPRRRRLGVTTPWPVRGRDSGELLVFAHRGLWGWTLGRMVRLDPLRETDSLEDLRRWIGEAVEAQRQSPGSREDRIEWLIGGVCTPSLRPWALYELVNELHPRRSQGEVPPRLTPAQQAVLAAAFLADPPRGASLIPMLKLLEGYDDPLVDQVLIGQVRELLAEECLGTWSVTVLRAALGRLGAQEALRRLEEEDRWPAGAGEIRRIWELGVEEAASAKIVERGQLGHEAGSR